MKTFLALMLVTTQVVAWPWTTADDCIEKYVPKAESNQGAKIVRRACVIKYQTKNHDDDYANCILDKVPSAKTDSAADMLNGLCRRENPKTAESYAEDIKRERLKQMIESDIGRLIDQKRLDAEFDKKYPPPSSGR